MTVKRQAPKNVFNASWLFGHPVARAANNGTAKWVKPPTPTIAQKGGGWVVELVGGVQTNDDWAACYIPTNEYPIQMFTEAQWSYYLTATQTMGVNIVFWVHNPDDFDKRAEITQLGGHADLEKSSGWNAHEFTTATAGMFFYGENTSGTLLTAGTQYTWAQFQTDNLFKNWVIYRISFESGWETSGTFYPAYLAEVKLNEVPVPLIPPSDLLMSDTAEAMKVTQIGLTGEKKMVVHPQILEVGTGEVHLVKGYNATGRFATEGYGVELVIHTDTDIAAVSFPLKMKLGDIKNMRLMEKGSHAINYCYLRHIGFSIDLSESSYFSETADDRELFNNWPTIVGTTSWTNINPLTGSAWKLRDGTLANKATPDETIASGTQATFAAFKATTLGDYMVKNITFYYPGSFRPYDPMWVMLGNWSINGIQYQVMPSPGQTFFQKYTGSSAIVAATTPLKPKMPFRLLSVELHLDAAATQETFALAVDAGRTASVYDTKIYSKAMAGVQDIVIPFGKGYEFYADDEIDATWGNSDTATYGLTYAYEAV